MSRPKIRFSPAERDQIRKQVVGKPTGVIFEVGGFELDLVPLTVEQATQVGKLVDGIGAAASGVAVDGEGNAKFDLAMITKLVEHDVPLARALLRNILFDSAVAGELVDESIAGEVETFDDWFGRLPVRQTLQELIPKLLESQGLQTSLGNSSTPPTEPTTTDATGNTTA